MFLKNFPKEEISLINNNNDILKIKTNWCLLLYENEEILNDKEINLIPNQYKFYIIRPNIVTKEIRLWHKNFIPQLDKNNNIIQNDCKLLNEILIKSKSNNIKFNIDNNNNILDENYYLIKYIKENNINYLKEFISRSNKNEYTLWYSYQLAKEYLKNDNINESYKLILECISENTLMSEFWCLLSAIYLRIGRLDLAYNTAKLAIEFGQNRNFEDFLPIEEDKYFEFPNEIINNILII